MLKYYVKCCKCIWTNVLRGPTINATSEFLDFISLSKYSLWWAIWETLGRICSAICDNLEVAIKNRSLENDDLLYHGNFTEEEFLDREQRKDLKLKESKRHQKGD